MKNTLLPPTQDSFSNLIGTPYSQLDCWGVVREFYRIEFGITLKKYYEETPTGSEATKTVKAGTEDFVRVETPQFGDIITLKINGILGHVGVFLNGQQFLHTKSNTGCIVDKLPKWINSVEGYYRWQKSD